MFKTNLIERLESKRSDEKGLALLDVLIGIAIFALIAIIAVTAISQYRARAYESGTVSDARQAGVAEEAAFTDGNGYLTTQAALEAEGVNFTDDNTVEVTLVGTEAFTLCVEHESGAYAEYSSAAGGVTDSGRTGGCQ